MLSFPYVRVSRDGITFTYILLALIHAAANNCNQEGRVGYSADFFGQFTSQRKDELVVGRCNINF